MEDVLSLRNDGALIEIVVMTGGDAPGRPTRYATQAAVYIDTRHWPHPQPPESVQAFYARHVVSGIIREAYGRSRIGLSERGFHALGVYDQTVPQVITALLVQSAHAPGDDRGLFQFCRVLSASEASVFEMPPHAVRLSLFVRVGDSPPRWYVRPVAGHELDGANPLYTFTPAGVTVTAGDFPAIQAPPNTPDPEQDTRRVVPLEEAIKLFHQQPAPLTSTAGAATQTREEREERIDMRLDFDGRLDYQGYHNGKAHCHMRIYRNAGDLPGAVVVLSELPDNHGTSVTNRIAVICEQVRAEHNVGALTLWVEHYPGLRETKDPIDHERFARWHRVDPNGERVGDVFVPLTREQLEQMIGQPFPTVPGTEDVEKRRVRR